MRNQYGSTRAEIEALRRQLVANGIDRDKAMTRLLKLVREEERANTLEKLADARSRSEGAER